MKWIKAMSGLILFLACSGLLLAGCATGAKQDPLSRPEGLYVEITTTKGLIVARLEYQKVPMTVANFVGLAEGTIENAAFPLGRPYFNGSVFHRVVADHVIQGGAPEGGQQDNPGYEYPNEIDRSLSHFRAGVLGIANGGPHTNSDQFYITLGDRSYLDGDYPIFGSVIEGLDVVKSIEVGDVMEKVEIVRAGDKANAFKADTETFTRLKDAVTARVEKEEKEKKIREGDFIRENWPNAITTASGLQYVITTEGTGEKPKAGSKIRVAYEGRNLYGLKFFSSADGGKPRLADTHEFFIFEVGVTSINPGFDEAVKEMRKGESRHLIVPAHLAYGVGGFYGKAVEGQKRFVISPNTLLIYRVAVLDIEN